MSISASKHNSGFSFFVNLRIVAISFFFAINSAHALSLDGQRIKIKGQWANGRFQVYKLKFKDPFSDSRKAKISGRITSIDREKHSLKIGPFEVQWSDKTKFKRLVRSDLEVGSNVKTTGVSNSPGVLVAKSIKPGSDSLDDDTISIDTAAVVIDARDENSTHRSPVFRGA